MTRWRVTGTQLPEGAEATWWVADGVLHETPVADAQDLPGRWMLPGLVDAHCHLTLIGGETGPVPAPPEHVTAMLAELRATGVLALRDTGAPDDTAVRLSVEGADGIDVVACGRFLAAPGRYFPGVYAPVTGKELPAAATAELAAGATWIKLVADFPPQGRIGATPEPSFDIGDVRRLIDAVPAAGRRVAAHVTRPLARERVEAGVDTIEHGTGLDEATLQLMAQRGAAWTPTLSAVLAPVPLGAPAEWAARKAERVELMQRLVPQAQRIGVPILTGSDVVGTVPGEVARLVEVGLPPAAALAAATTSARSYLGLPALSAGSPADLVTYDADPRDDPEVLGRPAAVVSRGRRVR
jgi:imidazolonepropionase-like amidohydrolase